MKNVNLTKFEVADLRLLLTSICVITEILCQISRPLPYIPVYDAIFFLPIHVTKRHLVLYIDVEFNKKISALAVSSVCVKRICKRRPVSVFGK